MPLFSINNLLTCIHTHTHTYTDEDRIKMRILFRVFKNPLLFFGWGAWIFGVSEMCTGRCRGALSKQDFKVTVNRLRVWGRERRDRLLSSQWFPVRNPLISDRQVLVSRVWERERSKMNEGAPKLFPLLSAPPLSFHSSACNFRFLQNNKKRE